MKAGNVEVTGLALVTKECTKCHKMRKFLVGTPRDEKSICGNCWDWSADPSFLQVTPEEEEKLRKLLSA